MTERVLVPAALVVLAACAGTPGPGDPGYPFNATGTYSGEFSVEGQVFPATLTLETVSGGAVSGTFRITSPIRLEGDVVGTVAGDELTMTASYRNNPMSGCDGTAEGTLTVGEGGETLAGSITVSDCGDVLYGRMSFSR